MGRRCGRRARLSAHPGELIDKPLLAAGWGPVGRALAQSPAERDAAARKGGVETRENTPPQRVRGMGVGTGVGVAQCGHGHGHGCGCG